jgi:hypothetical protein
MTMPVMIFSRFSTALTRELSHRGQTADGALNECALYAKFMPYLRSCAASGYII